MVNNSVISILSKILIINAIFLGVFHQTSSKILYFPSRHIFLNAIIFKMFESYDTIVHSF